MAKKKNSESRAVTVKTRQAIKNSPPTAAPAVVHNGLAEVLGFNTFPGNQGVPGTAQLSQTTTLFKNLRYYFLSNFRQVLSQAYVELGLVQTIVDVPVDDALRGGVDIKSKQLDENQIEELNTSLDREDDLNKIGQAAKWNRLFGGGGILVMTDQDPQEPLDIDAIDADSPLDIKAVDMWELYGDQQIEEGFEAVIDDEANPAQSDYFTYYAVKVHKSRVMKLKGIEAPSFVRPRLRGWGVSVVETLVRSMNQYLKATDLAFEVLDEFKLDVYKMKNLLNTLLAPGGEARIKQRIALANQQKNYQNAVVMDSEDDFDHKQLSFSGLAETMSGIRMQIAADMRMPITKLFGQSVSGGLGNNDQNDMENYNSMVESQIRSKIKYDILRVLELKCQKLFGFIPDDLSITFKPLRVLSAVDEETVKTSKFNRALALKTAGEITTYELREAVNKGELLDITLDNSGDELNPDDPDIDDLTSGEDDPMLAVDGNPEGADSEGDENIKPIPIPKAAAQKKGTGKGKAPFKKQSAKPIKNTKPRSVLAMKNELVKLGMKNSLAYDVAAYAVDGGDAQYAAGREKFYTDPETVDKALWLKAKQASQQAFGKVKWQFVKWFYEKEGGTFHGNGTGQR